LVFGAILRVKSYHNCYPKTTELVKRNKELTERMEFIHTNKKNCRLFAAGF